MQFFLDCDLDLSSKLPALNVLPDSWAQRGNLSSEFFVIKRESIMPVSLPLTPHRVSLNLIFRLFFGNFHERDLKLRGKFPAMFFYAGTCAHSMNKTGYHEFEVKERFLAFSPSAICSISVCP